MSGGWVATAAGAHLRGRPTRDTAPERALRSAVHRLGLRFRVHVPIASRCTPDFVLPRWRVAVFVDGCFWHGCPVHSRRPPKGPNAVKWQQKIQANRERDRLNNERARVAGWSVVRIWECEIKHDSALCAERVKAACHSVGDAASRGAHGSKGAL